MGRTPHPDIFLDEDSANFAIEGGDNGGRAAGELGETNGAALGERSERISKSRFSRCEF